MNRAEGLSRSGGRTAAAGGAGLVLASASPRRVELLTAEAIAFAVAPVEVDEDLSAGRPGADAAEVAAGLALRKALARAAREPGEARVLAADTIVVAPDGGRFLGKARDAAGARALIALLAGRTHRVVTGVALADAKEGRVETRAVESEVRFRDLGAGEIDDYARGTLWQGKAGGYGVQDRPSLVAEVRGSLTNVIGLPMEAVREMLA